MERILAAFSHQWDVSQTVDEFADAMRQELSETVPEVIWQEANSLAYDLIQSLSHAAKNGLDPEQFTPGEILLDAVCKVNKALSAEAR